MSEIYHSEIRTGEPQPRHHSVWGYLADTLMALVSIVVIAAAVLILAARYISPASAGLLSVLPLGAPLVFIVLVCVTFYWIIRWRKVLLFCTLCMTVLCTFHLSMYFKPEFGRSYGENKYDRKVVKVLSYNVHNFRSIDWTLRQEEFKKCIRSFDADIVCLQEFCDNVGEDWSAQFPKMYSTIGATNDSWNVILSRYKILRHSTVDSLSAVTAVWADVVVRKDTVRVMSVHLHSTGIGSDDSNFLESHQYITDTMRDERLRSILQRLVTANKARAEEAEHLRRFMDTSPYKLIVCGDFNDVPMSYTYRLVADDMTDTFRAAGKGFQHTYNGLFNMLRIDYILCSRGIDVASHHTYDSIAYSDHHPVLARLKFETK